jgi:antitoxin (DNA-binding transcriptional repressor) of toxin-antitoxin stability system
MESVDATQLKNHLGQVLRKAALGPVAVVRHGRVVAHLVPPPAVTMPGVRSGRRRRWTRREEERAVELCVRGDFRPSRWLRAGDARTLAGIAVMLASLSAFDRDTMLSLAERLDPGMSKPGKFDRWLAVSPVLAARFLPLVEARMRERRSSGAK